ncbi:MAG TPA: hypothetical protein VFF06_05985 [Polyangia bacterium]|nr:hypothetical protein [Polyangia bacterium]
MRAIALVFCFGICGCQCGNALPITPFEQFYDSGDSADLARGGDLAGGDLAGGDLAPVVNGDCPADAVFCEDFERGDTSRWDAENVSGASAIVDGLGPRGGRFALHVTVTGQSWAYLVKRLSAPGTLYARFWVKPISVGDDELSLLALSLGGSEGPSVRTSGPRIGRSEFPGGTWALGDVSRVDTIASETGVALGAWSCVELIPDDPSPVWVGGAPAFTVPPPTTPSGSELDVGIVQSFLSASAEYFLDDVVVATSRVGCH